MSGIRGQWARIVRERQHEEAARRDEPPLIGPVTGFDAYLWGRYAHTPVLGPVAGGKTPAGRLKWRADGPSLFVVKP